MSDPRTAAQSARWQQADALFAQLLDVDPAQRRSALAAATDSATLRADVARLLRAHEAESGVLDRPLPGAEADRVVGLSGRRLGPWLLGDPLGRGGMASVWRARRDDGLAEQAAAVKILALGQLGREGVTRFRRETAILGRLDHPGIVPLLDAGLAEDGTPWLAMALVEGEPIDAWCRRHDTDPRGIVALGLQVGEAVAYAHRNLVIHRDLKPSNVLVDAHGRTRLLDFGIARILDDATDATATRSLALTPQYAAPEQFAGAAPGTAMDIYGLGALLHRLLVGSPPRGADATGRPADTTQQLLALAQANDAPPAARRALRDDLGRVLLKALDPAPDRRYASMDALLDDLRHWLAGRPVRAHAPGSLYRLRRFARRHRVGLAAAAALIASLVLGVASVLWQAAQTRHQAERVAAVQGFLVRLLQAAEPSRSGGIDPPASEVLRRGAERVRGELATQPAMLAELLRVIGSIQLERGLHEDAEASLAGALAIHERGEGASPAGHAETLLSRALLDYEQGERQRAVQRLREAAAVLERDAPDATDLADSVQAHLADLLVATHQLDAARAVGETITARLRAAGRDEGTDYILATRALAAVADLEGRTDEALALLAEAMTRQRRIAADGLGMAGLENERGVALYGAGRLQEAAQSFESALQRQRGILGSGHPVTLSTFVNLAGARLGVGEIAQAAADYREIAAAQRSVAGERAHPDLAHTLGFLALADYRHGDLAAARTAAEEALAMRQSLPADERQQLHWVGPLAGLLRLEAGVADPQRWLHDGAAAAECSDLPGARALTRWLCLARALVDRAPAAVCATPLARLPDAAGTPALEPVDRRWWMVFWLLRLDCTGAEPARSRRAIQALAAGLPGEPPPWLAQRLAQAGLVP